MIATLRLGDELCETVVLTLHMSMSHQLQSGMRTTNYPSQLVFSLCMRTYCRGLVIGRFGRGSGGIVYCNYKKEPRNSLGKNELTQI